MNLENNYQLTIPEGNVKRITDSNSQVLWKRAVSTNASQTTAFTPTRSANALGITVAGNSKRTIEIDGTEYDVPSSITLLDYLEGDGSSYINTNYIVNYTDLTLEYKYRKTSSLYREPLGFDAGNTPRLMHGHCYSTSLYYGDSAVVTSATQALDTDYEVKFEISNALGYGKWDINGTQWASSSSGLNGWTDENTATQTYPDFIFASNNGTEARYVMIGRIYYVRYFKSGVLERAFYPAKRTSDNVLGMYDFVTQTFFTNAGTGSFTAGNELPTPDDNLGVKGVGEKTEQLYDVSETAINSLSELFAITKPTRSRANVAAASTVGEAIDFHASPNGIAIPCSQGDSFSWKEQGTPSSARRVYTELDANGLILFTRVFYTASGLSYTVTNASCAYLMIEWSLDATDISQMVVVEGSTIPSSYVPYGYALPLLKAENCGCVDLGTLTWSKVQMSDWCYFLATVTDKNIVGANMYCSDTAYTCVNVVRTQLTNMQIGVYFPDYDNRIALRNDDFDDATVIKASLSGTYLYYQRTTDDTWVEPTTYNAYLANQLQKVGTYADTLSGSSVTKNVGIITFDGTETWTYDNTLNRFYTNLPLSVRPSGSKTLPAYCTHFEMLSNGESSASAGQGYIGVTTSSNPPVVYLHASQTSLSDWTTWLASNNVTLYYPLDSSTTEVPTIPDIPLSRETTTYWQLNTTTEPSSSSLQYLGEN